MNAAFNLAFDSQRFNAFPQSWAAQTFSTFTAPVSEFTTTSEIKAPKLYAGLCPAPAPLKSPPILGEI
jgi:hypothetical protein